MGMSEYRSVPETDVPDFQRILSYAFSPTEEHEPIDSLEDLSPRATLGDRRAIYEGSEIRCTAVQHWFRLQVRGEFEEAPGLSAVATPPEYRRKGLVGRLLAESLAEYRDRGAGFCALWPFSHPFYRQFGWELCSRYGRVTCQPEALAGIGSVKRGGEGRSHEFRRCSAEDWDALDRVYCATNDRDLAMDRTEDWWRKRVFTGWDDDPYVTGIERDGRVVGYLVYDIEEGEAGDGRRMIVREAGHVDSAAYRAVLEFCRNHDSQVEECELRGPVDTSLQDLACDPSEIDVEVEPGPMIRIVDLSQSLAALSYPSDVEADLVLDITDTVADWNEGRFRLSIGDGSATCEPAGGGVDADAGSDSDSIAGSDSDLTASIATLSGVAVGHLSVEHGETVGDFEVASAEAREALEAAFPPRETFLREFF
ncbi:GNAT family N-acetyltransferase [Halobacteriales archaeon QS_3_64_16]|nr:MAG: GNAT family N-acetyltransferase [Halobacteriales archaeon QS_3_64_16]